MTRTAADYAAMAVGEWAIDDTAELDAALSATDNGGIIVAQAANVGLRRHCIARAHDLGGSDRLPSAWAADGVITSAAPDTARSDTTARPVERAYVLDDISIRADGTGRTVVAYCAPFNVEAEITDQDGHYFESLARTSFDKTIKERAGQISCFYNHGRTLFGTPSDTFSIPLGAPKEITADGRGVLTTTAYNRSATADMILDSILNGDPMGMSFSGRFMPGQSQRTRGGKDGLDNVVRLEVALREYGPTPTPAYKEAAILGVRSGALIVTEVVDTIHGLSDTDRRELIRILDTSRSDTDTATAAVVAPVEGPSPTAGAADPGTSTANDGPPEVLAPVGPSKDQRQRRARALTLAPKGQATHA